MRVRPITDGGAISFRFFYRFVMGKQKWLTLKACELPEARNERDLHANAERRYRSKP